MKCSKCGRDNYCLLEIHHRNNNGKKDRKKYPGAKFYDAIIQGKRKTKDLELYCKICNWESELNRLKKEYPIQ